jgi:hypothetical protein
VNESEVEELARSALEWLAGEARPVPDGIAWTGATDQDEPDPTLYSGGAGVVIALLEAYRHFGELRWADLAVRAGRPLVAQARGWENHSLYFGTTGIAWALHSLGTTLGSQAEQAAARDLLASVRRAFGGERWGAAFDLIGGNAGIALGALAMGDLELAETAVEPTCAARRSRRTASPGRTASACARAVITSRTAPWASPTPSPRWVRCPAART